MSGQSFLLADVLLVARSGPVLPTSAWLLECQNPQLSIIPTHSLRARCLTQCGTAMPLPLEKAPNLSLVDRRLIP